MAAEENVITTEEMAKVRQLDWTQSFTEKIELLMKMLGITRKIPVVAGTALEQTIVTGTLEDGDVDEGDIIPLSQYEVETKAIGTAALKKFRKATTAEAIIKSGFDVAVNDTDSKMIFDIQKVIKGDFITELLKGTGTATGTGVQDAFANAWGQLQVAYEDNEVATVFIANPLDISDYLGKAQITTQTAFGLTYVENFLGLGTLILTGAIEKGTFVATASQNLNLLYINVAEANGLGSAFDFTTDETGLIGIHEDSNYTRMQNETVATFGIYLFPEMPAGVIVGEITSPDTP